MLKCLVGMLLVLVAASGCGEKKGSKTKGQGEKGESSTGGASAKEKRAPVIKAPTANIPDNEVQALVDTWLAAQNEGDFAAYERVYADKFTGTKRVGSKTTRYARKGWLADRGRMFKRKMIVSAADREIHSSTMSAEVQFVQHWASGKFEDQGPKRLLVVRQGSELKIAQEEMLNSEVQSTKYSVRPNQFYFLLQGGIALHDADLPPMHGTPELVASEVYAARASLKEEDIKETVTRWKGKKVRTDTGCEATVSGFFLLSRVEPHFATTQQWSCSEDMFDEGDECMEATDLEIANQVFSEEDAILVAELDACSDGIYAQVASLAPAQEAEIVQDSRIDALALKAFASLEAVTSQDGEGDNKDWWKGLEEVEVYKHPTSQQVLVSVWADNGGSCGEFSASHWQVWEYVNGKLRELAGGSPPEYLLRAIDVDGDGSLELLTKGGGFGAEFDLYDSETLTPRVTRSYRYDDCGC